MNFIQGTETRSLPVFIALQDYTPDAGDAEAIPLEQGQIVEVLDNKNASSWLVRTKVSRISIQISKHALNFETNN